ncbi:MAG: hypothetical protein PVG66_02490 [Chromatiales bacterium]|jgi:hypothetical protein
MRQCCSDHNGNIKKKYKTKEEAEKVAELRKDDGVAITVYPCEGGNGWHLTSRNAPPPERPKNVMTKEETKLYTKQHRNRLGNLFDEALVAQIKNEAKDNTLSILKKKLESLQSEFNERYREFDSLRKQYRRTEREKEGTVDLREFLIEAEQNIKMTRQKLRDAKQEYESAKRRIERLRR